MLKSANAQHKQFVDKAHASDNKVGKVRRPQIVERPVADSLSEEMRQNKFTTELKSVDNGEANFNSLLQDYQAIENEAGKFMSNPNNSKFKANHAEVSSAGHSRLNVKNTRNLVTPAGLAPSTGKTTTGSNLMSVMQDTGHHSVAHD